MLYLAFLLPLLGGAVLPLFRFRTVKARAIYVEAVVITTSLIMGWLIWHRTDTVYPLMTLGGNLQIAFKLDGTGCVFAGLVAILWPLASLYGFEYMQHEERPNTFFAWYTMTYGITLAVATSANLVSMYIFYECMTLVTLPLVLHKMDNASASAARKYLYYNISGAAMGFVAMVGVLYAGGADNAFTLGGIAMRGDIRADLLRLFWLLTFFGFGTKAALFPMYAWLPAASVAPTPVTALLHAVAVVNTGAFAVIRSTYYVFGPELLSGSAAQTIALVFACFTILFGSSMAVKEQHFKRRLAYSTISNLSYMLMGAALMSPAGMVGSLSHMVLHGTMKITLFYCAGAVLVRSGKEYVQDLRGFGKVMPFTCAVFTLGAVAMVGIPPLCGFVSKWNLLTAAAGTGLPMGTVAIVTLIISAVLTGIYLFSVSAAMYFRPLNENMAHLAGKNIDPGWMMKLPFAILCIAIIVLGLWSAPLVTFMRNVAAGLIF